MNGKQRGLVLVAASLPQVCVVCHDLQSVLLVSYDDHVPVSVTSANCPHCNNHGHPVPIIVLPMRTDVPKEAA